MKAIRITFIKLIFLLFSVTTGWLFIMSCFKHCEIDMSTFEQYKFISGHTTIIYLGMAVVFALILCAVYVFLFPGKSEVEKKYSKYSPDFIIPIITIGIIVAISIFWVMFMDSPPRQDQLVIFQEA